MSCVSCCMSRLYYQRGSAAGWVNGDGRVVNNRLSSGGAPVPARWCGSSRSSRWGSPGSAGRRMCPQSAVGGGYLRGPGPAGGQLEDGPAASADDAGGDVEPAVAYPFRFRGPVRGEAQGRGPGDQVPGEQDGVEPVWSWLKSWSGRLRRPLSRAHGVLGAGM